MLIIYFDKQDVLCTVKEVANVFEARKFGWGYGVVGYSRDQDLFPQISPHLNYYNN